MPTVLPDGTVLPEPYGYCENLRPTDGIEETSNPFRAIYDIARGFLIVRKCYNQIAANETIGKGFQSAQQWYDDLVFFNNASLNDLAILFALAIVWTIMMKVFDFAVFEPLSRILGVQPKNQHKFRESGWKGTVYTFNWTYMVYASFFRGHDIFYKSMELFTHWNYREHPLDIKIGYFLEASYYTHAIYATLFVEARRKDTYVMVLHHIVTLALILVSYVIGFLHVGMLVFLLDDISDIFLEAGKFTSYLRYTKRGYSYFFEIVSLLFSFGFCSSWFICRIIWHLTKVWRGGSLGSVAGLPFLPVPFHIYFNTLLGALYFFYCYWFWFIVAMVYGLITGKKGLESAVEDTRELEDEKDKKDKKKKK